MARIRTFLSVDIGEQVRSRVLNLQSSLAESIPEVRWVEEESLHITLLFLGEVNELDLVPICRIATAVGKKLPPFTLEIGGLGAFPNQRRPKILWLGVGEGKESLQELHDSLETPLLEQGCYRREDREYTPHLTLGRLTKEDESIPWSSLFAENSTSLGEIKVEEILIMSSELRRDGPVYTVLGRAPLKGKKRRSSSPSEEG
jgi:2'-5' RNA ligase